MNHRFSLEGKTALVTGAGSGLGQQFAMTLAEAGADVILAARRVDKLEETAADIEKQFKRRTVTVAMDVTDRSSVIDGVAAGEQALGVASIVINNAGISREAFALTVEQEDYNAVIDTNLNGVFWVAQATARRMVETQTKGSIVNIASILGRRVQMMLTAYSAAKAGVIRMTESLALEWVRHGIRVNAIAPGFFVTDINREFFETAHAETLLKRIPMRRPGERAELDGALLLLASDAGSFMTGSTISVDGGHTVNPL
ncbi:MAG: SDR family NAD(P)-dependent oxidoreductase [Pseudomonadota bacterium]